MTTVIEGSRTAHAASAQPAAGESTQRARPGHRLAALGPGDRDALTALFARCSPETVRLRFFGFLRAFPEEYADALLSCRPMEHDAVLAYPDAHGCTESYPCACVRPVGLASLAAGPGTDPSSAELGVLVCDGWQRQGVGTAMAAALIVRARERGIARVSASVLPGRAALLRSMSDRLAGIGLVPRTPAAGPGATAPSAPASAPPVSYAWTDGSLTAVYRLSEPFWQGPAAQSAGVVPVRVGRS